MGLKPLEINLISIEHYAICQFGAAVVMSLKKNKFFRLTLGISFFSPLCWPHQPVWHIYRRLYAVVHIYKYNTSVYRVEIVSQPNT